MNHRKIGSRAHLGGTKGYEAGQGVIRSVVWMALAGFGAISRAGSEDSGSFCEEAAQQSG